MASRNVIFDLNSLTKLLVHYTEGCVPLDSEPKQFMVSQYLPRWIGLVLESKDWSGTQLEKAGYGGTEPFFIRYESKRLMQWQGGRDDYGLWTAEGAIEAPKRQ